MTMINIVDSQINVLLVDDRPENLVALEAVLSSNDVNYIKCISGEDALKYLIQEECALILLDVQMPGIDGYETAKLIKARAKNKDTPIIFITAINQDPEHVFAGYAVGAIDYIFKPFDPDVLKSKVDSFVELYANNKKMVMQTLLLNEKTKELEQVNNELSLIASKLQRAEALARVIGETSMDTMITFDASHSIMTINPAVLPMFGYQIEQIIDEKVDLLFREPLIPSWLNRMKEDEPDKVKLLEIDAVSSDGTIFPVEVQIHESYLDGLLIYACTVKDITERKAQLAELKFMAMHDGLTGLPNRTLLYEKMKNLIQLPSGQQSFALIVFDLNHFKEINDTLGHSYGDALLQRLGTLIHEELSAEETIVRLGGDEFAVLLPNYDKTTAINKTREILDIIERPVIFDGITLAIGVSLGIVLFPDHGQSADILLQRADIAMYSAKRNGSGYELYDKHHDQNDPYRLVLMGELRKAIENGELILYYQPTVRMATREIIGVEALVRWNHPKYGLIPPADFIPLAEQSGFINPLTYWVLEEAIRQCKAWEEEGIDIHIAVNLSVRSLQDSGFPLLTMDLILKHKLRADKLHLEITESFLMSDTVKAFEVLSKLKSMGVNLSIDDFGTGFSSLSYLKNLPVGKIKIDKSFVLAMTKESDNAMIVRSTIMMAHNLRLLVVAEGVEDIATWETLESWGCDVAQGYLMSRPQPPKDFIKWLKEQKNEGKWG
jgi:diguanylate cyclase (GGDEF)-like protein/PAS domain S-box-containing protein